MRSRPTRQNNDSYDRRAARRVPCGLYVDEVDEQRITPCQATNISESGVYLRRLSGGVLLYGEQVRLQIPLPGDEEPVWAAGQVIEPVEEVLHDAAAVEFTAISEADRRRLGRYVDVVRRQQTRAALAGLSRLQSAVIDP